MANNDTIIGFFMAFIGIAGILAEFYYLIIDPVFNGNPFANFRNDTDGVADYSQLYWAIVLPLFVGTGGVLAIILWIGITMIQTPPPEAWDFDDLEDELGETSDDSMTSETSITDETEKKTKVKPKKETAKKAKPEKKKPAKKAAAKKKKKST